ncbi:MAG: methyltransferase domain-containing protein [Promicromonosporaceae bacterium]|nr:methyltransferase domain-containing protein [Promicromonosporaceae bacterium]
MDLTQAVRARFDGRAPEYDDSTMHRSLATAVAEFVDLAGVRDVLDAGTGTGLVLRALRSRDPLLRLAGVDLSPGMLGVARSHLPDVELVEGDATSLPFADASFDVVTCATALHLFPDGDAALRDWLRVLRPGGRVVTATFGEMDPTQHGAAHGGTVPPYPTQHDRYDSFEDLETFGAAAGLRLTRRSTWTHGHDAVLLAELRR